MSDLPSASAAVARNPLLGIDASDVVPIPACMPLSELPAFLKLEREGPLVCVVNGEVVSRLTSAQRIEVVDLEEAGGDFGALQRVYAERCDGWRSRITRPGDVVHWHVISQKGSIVGVVIGLVIAGVSAYFGFAPGVNFGLTLAASSAIGGIINLLLAPRQRTAKPQEQGIGVYSTSLAGNAARLDAPIWWNFGRPKITPPFACNPYGRFLPKNPSAPLVDCDQYFYAIYAVGIGPHIVEKAFLGKTPITVFQDVLRAQYLPPGTAPSVVVPNIVTCPEVTTELELAPGQYVGPYTLCRPGDTVTDIEIDTGANQGLGKADGSSITVKWSVQVRPVDDNGVFLTDWQTLGSHERTMFTNTPQRWTESYHLAAPIRAEVRVFRTNAKDTSGNVRDGLQWIGMRGRLSRPAPLDPNTAHYEVVLRSSSQLANETQRDLSLIVRKLTRTWNPTTGWSAPVFTRNAAWALAELWSSSILGEGLPDERIDLQGLYQWSLTLDARQDHFDYTFTDPVAAWDAAQLIAISGRAKAFRKGAAVRTIARDEYVDLPSRAITPRIAQPQSMVMHEVLPGREQADGLIVQYLSNLTWDIAQIECPCPGYTVSNPADPRYDGTKPSMANPKFITLDGITGAKHAEREGLYQAASMALRQGTTSATVEMEGQGYSVLDTVRWQPQIPGYGQAGDVAFWDPTSRVMGLTEKPDFSGGPTYLTLQRDDLSLTTPVLVSPGPTEWDVVLPAAPDFALVLDSGIRERPKFILGTLTASDEKCKVAGIADGGKSAEGAQLYEITLVLDSDSRVHTADNRLLPGPGDVQDPIDDGTTNTVGVPFSAVINLDARANKQFAHAIKLDGINPSWVLRFTLPTGQKFTAWSEFAGDGDPFVIGGNPWYSNFMVTSELGVGGTSFGAAHSGSTAEAARAAFGGGSVTGSRTYYFWIDSDGIDDNRGGLSILVTKD